MSTVVLCARVLSVLVVASNTQLWAAEDNQERKLTRSGREVFESTCIACHGPDGRGTVNPTLTKIVALPDFSDCNFAAREPDADWVAVAHNGGPARGFSALMPPWAGMFTAEELTLAVNHLRTFCTDERWPRGELNLPRPLVTEKAFPEDEIVVSTSATTRDDGEVTTKFIYERRFGTANQVEVAVPFASLESNSGSWASGVGDVAVAYKRTLFHSLRHGNIFSLSGEVVLPTGSEQRGLGKGFAIFEPFVTFGQLLPGDSFVQAQGGLEIPATREEDEEAFWRAALGRSFQQGKFGRTWSPMVEVLGARSLATGAPTHWDLVPQVQITLNARQHLRLNGGVRLPINDRSERTPTVVFYFLWDWFDGGLFEGW
jgi:hypothetical protein